MLQFSIYGDSKVALLGRHGVERLQRLRSGVFLKTGTSIVGVLVGLTVSVALNRVYGKEAYGLLVLVYAVTAFAFAVSDFGAKITLIHFIPLWVRQGREEEAAQLFAASLFLHLGGIFTFGLLMFGASGFVAETFFLQPTLTALIKVGVGYFVAFALFDFFVQTFQALQDWRRESLLNLLFAWLQIISVCLVALALRWEIAWILVGNALAAAGTVMVAIAWLPRAFLRAVWRLTPRAAVPGFGTAVRFGLPLSLQAMYRFAISWFDKILLGRLGAPGDLALYYIACLFLNGLTNLFKVLPTIFAPYVAEISDADPFSLRRKFSLIVRLFLQVASLASLIVFFAVEPVVLILYGPSYGPVVSLTRALLLVFFLRACRDPFALFLTHALSMVRTVVILGTILTLTTVAATGILVPVYGVWGAVAASVLGNVVTCGAVLVLVPSLRAMVPAGSVWISAGGLILVGGAYTLLSQTPIPLALLALGLLILYCATLVGLGEIGADDLRIAKEIVRPAAPGRSWSLVV